MIDLAAVRAHLDSQHGPMLVVSREWLEQALAELRADRRALQRAGVDPQRALIEARG